jgi:hypothetical protein
MGSARDVLQMRLAPARSICYLFWSVAELLLFATSTMRRAWRVF